MTRKIDDSKHLPEEGPPLFPEDHRTLIMRELGRLGIENPYEAAKLVKELSRPKTIRTLIAEEKARKGRLIKNAKAAADSETSPCVKQGSAER